MKVIIINGPCGVGKSTVAAKLHDALPMSFLMNVDDQRRLFSHYRENQEESRQSTTKLTEAMLSSCLDIGCDVIIEKMLYEHEILDSYYKIAQQKGAEVREVMLWAPKNVVMERAGSRGWKEGGLLTPEKCEFFWEQIDKIKNERSKAIIIDTSELSEEEVFARVQEVLN